MRMPRIRAAKASRNVLSSLFVAEKVSKENQQARSGFPIPAIEGISIAGTDFLPEFPVVCQLDLLPILRGNDGKSSE